MKSELREPQRIGPTTSEWFTPYTDFSEHVVPRYKSVDMLYYTTHSTLSPTQCAAGTTQWGSRGP